MNIIIEMYALAKRIGLTLDEINEMSTETFIDIVAAYMGTYADSESPREATQADIDSFLM